MSALKKHSYYSWSRIVGAIAGLCTAIFAVPASAEVPIWTVESESGGRIEIISGGRIVKSGGRWRDDRLVELLRNVDEFWLEIPITSEARAESRDARDAHSALPQGESLPDILPQPVRSKLYQVLALLDLPVEQVSGLRPWAARGVFTAALYSELGYDPSQDIVTRIVAEVPAETPRGYLETPLDQILLFSELSDEAQIELLEATLDEILSDPRRALRQEEVWLEGDVAGIRREVLNPFRASSEEAYQVALVDRDRRYVAILDRLLREGRSIAVVLGTAHLVGPESVPLQLYDLGHTVTGPIPIDPFGDND